MRRVKRGLDNQHRVAGQKTHRPFTIGFTLRQSKRFHIKPAMCLDVAHAETDTDATDP